MQDSKKSAVIAGFRSVTISKLDSVAESKSGNLIDIPIAEINLSHPQCLCYTLIVPLSNLADSFLAFAEEKR